MPWTFKVRRDAQQVRGGFFPDLITQTTKYSTVSRAITLGLWENTRLVTGDVEAVLKIVDKVVDEYDFMRKKHPEITSVKLFEDMPVIKDLGLEYWDYSGSLQSISRESALISFDEGQIRALERNFAIGFRGVIRKARAPWSQATWVGNEFRKRIHQALARSEDLKKLSSSYIRKIIAAQRKQLKLEYQLIHTELQKAYTDERFNALAAAWEALVALEEALDIQFHLAENTLDVIPAYIPPKEKVIELFRQGLLTELNWEAYDPFLDQTPDRSARIITFIRQAFLTNGKMAITITPRPQVHTDELERRAVKLKTSINYVTYGTPPDEEVDITVSARQIKGGGASSMGSSYAKLQGWDGSAAPSPAWSILTAKETPELTGALNTKICSINDDVGILLPGLNMDKPVILAGSIKGFGTKAPHLLLPDMMTNVDIMPLITEFLELAPTEVNHTVEGVTLQRAGTLRLHEASVAGFLTKPAAGRPSRTGIITELFP